MHAWKSASSALAAGFELIRRQAAAAASIVAGNVSSSTQKFLSSGQQRGSSHSRRKQRRLRLRCGLASAVLISLAFAYLFIGVRSPARATSPDTALLDIGAKEWLPAWLARCGGFFVITAGLLQRH